MINELNSIQKDSLVSIFAGIWARIKKLESLFLQLRSSSQTIFYEVLANGDTDMQFDTHSAVKVTPTTSTSYTTTVPPAGSHVTLLILTSGTSSYTITFGTGFKSTGTLATGTTSARVFALQFISDGTNLYEVSRTVAMVA